MIKLTLPYPPSSNRYWRSRAYVNKVTRKPQAFTYVSEEAKAYKETVSRLVDEWEDNDTESGLNLPLQGEIGYRVKVFRPQRSGDLSNRLKVLEDALQGSAFVDDSQISEFHAERFEDKIDPRVEIEIYVRGLL